MILWLVNSRGEISLLTHFDPETLSRSSPSELKDTTPKKVKNLDYVPIFALFSSKQRTHRTKLKIGLLKGKQTSCQLQENYLGVVKLFLISPSRICLSAWHIWLNGRKWKSNNKVWPIQQSSAVFRLQMQDGQRISFLFLTHNNFPQMVQLLSSASRQDTRREISNKILSLAPASNLL